MPFYLSIGMSADEYWNKPPHLVNVYRDAYKLKLRQDNEAAWLAGMYVNAAVSVSIQNAFGKKGSKKAKYPKEPANLGLDTEWEKAEKARREREKIIANLTLFKQMWDRHNKSGEKS